MPRTPNIVLILSDDQGAWAMGCSGLKALDTPNLDRMAASGMRFENFFCVSPVCSPARASLLTGVIPSRHGVHDWLRSGNIDAGRFADAVRDNPHKAYADEDEPIQFLKGQTTYTDLLRERGYSLALSGKWHLGDSIHPQHGFDRWFTIGKGGCHYFHPDIVEDEKITVRHGEYVTDLITDRAIEFMEEMAAKPEPFYLSVHYTAPHAPWAAEHHPARLIERYDRCSFDEIPDVPDHRDSTAAPVYGTEKRHENLRGYFAAITAMDEGIGRILDALDEKGLTDNTLVLFTSDNGMNMGHHGVWGKGNGTFPMNMYDTAVKVPFIARWPGHIRSGAVCDDSFSAYDVFPTVADILGIRVDHDARLPGRSLLPVLLGEKDSRPEREVVVYDEYGPVRMIRTKEWKYIHRFPYGPHELYDLKIDPGETNNLAGQREYETLILSLRDRMLKWFARYADPEMDGTREGVTGLGQLSAAGASARKATVYQPRPPIAHESKS